MGAGNQTDHWHQDAGEKYIVFKLQELAVNNGTALTDTFEHNRLDFENQCTLLGITESFKKTIYCTNVDKWAELVYNDYVSLYPNEKFDFVNVEKEYRDKGLKGDYILQFEDREVSQGLKNQNDHTKAQMCSGTWNSLLNNFIFESAGSGMFYVPNKELKWKGSTVRKRDFFLKEEGYEELLPMYHRMDDINAKVKKFYVYGEEARFHYNIEQQLDDDRKTYGKEISSLIVKALDIIGNDKVTKRVKKMTGLDAAEELLILSPKGYLLSLTNPNYMNMLKRVNSEDAKLSYEVNGQSIKFTFSDNQGFIIDWNIPFTFNINGCWWGNQPGVESWEGQRKYTGTRKDAGTPLYYKERRPQKSKEFATSINTHIDFKSILNAA
tara:strand:+ start:50 stop:1192 length:1143 start_codon:yes stop_codon:yes gene_type:complete